MIGKIKSLFGREKSLGIDVDAALDHIELADDYMMLGLFLGWHNQMKEVLEVQEIQVRLFHQGRRAEPVRFYFQGRFEHLEGQKQIVKKVGPQGFRLEAGEQRVRGVRFYTRAILNLPEGNYLAEVHSTTAEGTYVNEVKLPIANKLKYRTSNAWSTERRELIPHH